MLVYVLFLLHVQVLPAAHHAAQVQAPAAVQVQAATVPVVPAAQAALAPVEVQATAAQAPVAHAVHQAVLLEDDIKTDISPL